MYRAWPSIYYVALVYDNAVTKTIHVALSANE